MQVIAVLVSSEGDGDDANKSRFRRSTVGVLMTPLKALWDYLMAFSRESAMFGESAKTVDDGEGFKDRTKEHSAPRAVLDIPQC